ncbi:MAG TPA: enoyl-CoA hydratase-related protein [Desulfobacteria bacterium]|nr:enoyl-CoA hydratase-related protein [Desulfobacteria bacterium]
MEAEWTPASGRDHVMLRKKGGLCTILLNRPSAMNAVNGEMVTTLRKVFQTIGEDEDIQVVVLEGAGGNFCAGGDMAWLGEEKSAPHYLTIMRSISHMIMDIREIPQPVLCKVRGAAVGGGANFALACDFVLASHNARFQEVFIHVGAGLDAGGTFFLPRLVGLAKAKELAMLGKAIDGETAVSMGLIYKSVPDEVLDGEVAELVETLAAKSSKALASIKQGLDASMDMSLAQVLEREAVHQSILFQTNEHKQAVKRFLKSRRK